MCTEFRKPNPVARSARWGQQVCARRAVQVVSVQVLLALALVPVRLVQRQRRVAQTWEESVALVQVGLERHIQRVLELLVAHMQQVQAQLEAWVLAVEQRVLRQLLRDR